MTNYEEAFFEFYENNTADFAFPNEVIKVGAGTRIITSTFKGPFFMDKDAQVGPDVTVGIYTGFNKSCFIARGSIGAFCAVGARVSINPFNHPTDWLSTHEFQYHTKAFDWVAEYNEVERLERTPDMFHHTVVGNDVWIGHNANIMPGVNVGDGAVIGAGAVVTKDVPPYAIVAGMPANIIRYRFDEPTIERLLSLKWWEMELSDLSGMPFRDIEQCIGMLEEIKARAK